MVSRYEGQILRVNTVCLIEEKNKIIWRRGSMFEEKGWDVECV